MGKHQALYGISLAIVGALLLSACCSGASAIYAKPLEGAATIDLVLANALLEAVAPDGEILRQDADLGEAFGAPPYGQFAGMAALAVLSQRGGDPLYRDRAETAWQYCEQFFDLDTGCYDPYGSDPLLANAWAIIAAKALYDATRLYGYLQRADTVAAWMDGTHDGDIYGKADVPGIYGGDGRGSGGDGYSGNYEQALAVIAALEVADGGFTEYEKNAKRTLEYLGGTNFSGGAYLSDGKRNACDNAALALAGLLLHERVQNDEVAVRSIQATRFIAEVLSRYSLDGGALVFDSFGDGVSGSLGASLFHILLLKMSELFPDETVYAGGGVVLDAAAAASSLEGKLFTRGLLGSGMLDYESGWLVKPDGSPDIEAMAFALFSMSCGLSIKADEPFESNLTIYAGKKAASGYERFADAVDGGNILESRSRWNVTIDSDVESPGRVVLGPLGAISGWASPLGENYLSGAFGSRGYLLDEGALREIGFFIDAKSANHFATVTPLLQGQNTLRIEQPLAIFPKTIEYGEREIRISLFNPERAIALNNLTLALNEGVACESVFVGENEVEFVHNETSGRITINGSVMLEKDVTRITVSYNDTKKPELLKNGGREISITVIGESKAQTIDISQAGKKSYSMWKQPVWVGCSAIDNNAILKAELHYELNGVMDYAELAEMHEGGAGETFYEVALPDVEKGGTMKFSIIVTDVSGNAAASPEYTLFIYPEYGEEPAFIIPLVMGSLLIVIAVHWVFTRKKY
ncbi:MAG: hypothetical protein CVT48_01005 [Thermoplasmata archaeon HGW-Thermoplasmata-1]|nr:MAG: hypothetical protein CVT48_01005 [Thermoplasmata archaeon HGW-Thermoplasmata-1]